MIKKPHNSCAKRLEKITFLFYTLHYCQKKNEDLWLEQGLRQLERLRYGFTYSEFGVSMEISKHIIRVPNHKNSLALMAKAKDMKIVPRFPEMPDGIAFLCLPEVEPRDEPAIHNNNSHAEYTIDWYRYTADDGRENIIWFSRIPPKKGTSKPAHIHGTNPINKKGVYEHYIKVVGNAYIGEGVDRRLMNKYEIVPPNTEHYIESDEGANFFILIENVEGIKNEDIHEFPTTT